MNVSNKQHSFFGQELQSEITRLISDSIQKSSNTFLRSLNLVKAIVAQRPQQRATGIELAERWVRFNLETSYIINRHSQEAVNEILDTLEHYGFFESTSSMPNTPTSKKRTQPKVEINLSARKGEKATTSFIVANPSREEMEATFTVTEFVNEDGHLVQSKGVQFSPATLKLPPNKEATVQMLLKVDQKFKVGKIYLAMIRLPGHSREFALKLHVLRSHRTKSRTSKGSKT